MRVAYYPGSAFKNGDVLLENSFVWVCQQLGVDLDEIPNWNEVGDGWIYTLDRSLSIVLAGRVLALADMFVKSDYLVVPDPSPFQVMRWAEKTLRADPELRAEVEKLVGAKLQLKARVVSGLYAVTHLGKADKLRSLVIRNLKGFSFVINVSPRLLTPTSEVNHDSVFNPTSLAEMLSVTKAEVVRWKYECYEVGGETGFVKREIAVRSVGKMLEEAERLGVTGIVFADSESFEFADKYRYEAESQFRKKFNVDIFYYADLLSMTLGQRADKLFALKQKKVPVEFLKELGYKLK